MTHKVWMLSAVAALVFVAGTASAQEVTPSDGLDLPDASLATVSDATALEVNPGGLGFMSRPEIGYGFQLASEDLRGVTDEAQAYFMAAGTGWFGAGLAAQWLTKPALGGELQSYRKFTLGSGLALGRFGVGLGLNLFGSSDNERLDGIVGLDIGMQLRASRYLGAALMIRDANSPFLREERSLPTRIEGSLALRFFDGRLAVEQAAETNLLDRYVRLVPRLSFEAVPGLRAFGRTEFLLTRVSGSYEWTWEAIFAGLELSLGSIGAQYAATTRLVEPNDAQKFAGISAYHWISPSKRAPLFPLTKRWIYVNLNREITEEPQGGLFQKRTRSFLSVARELERIAQGGEVEGVVLGLGGNLTMAQSWEIRRLMAQVRSAGKKTVAVMSSGDLRSYYLATSAEQIWYVPTDVMSPMGLRSSFLSIRGALAKLGVEAQFVRIGDYKTTPEMFVVDEPTEANDEQRNAYLDAYWGTIVGDLAKARGKSSDEMEKLLAEVHLPDEAVERRLVDRIVYADEIEKILRDEHQATLEPGFAEPSYVDDEWRGGPQIAVVAVDGNIVQGSSNSAPLIGGSVAGARSLTTTLNRLRKDPNVKAVVVRVDSVGGSAIASDLIYRAIRKLAAHKPVVASMGSVAASGGYYVAAGADEIFATPTTMTGSIGIFAGKVNVARLAERVGVSTSALERGNPGSFANIWDPWDDDELADIGRSLNYMYRLFLVQAAHTRPLEVDELDQVARGRVWAGQAAKDNKLVDGIGGVMDAIHRAEDLAGLPRGRAEYRQYTPGSRLGLAVDLQTRAARLLGLDRPSTAEQLLHGNTMIGRFVRETSFAWQVPLLYDSGEPLMMLPGTFILE